MSMPTAIQSLMATTIVLFSFLSLGCQRGEERDLQVDEVAQGEEVAQLEEVTNSWDGVWQTSGALREVNLHGRIDATTGIWDFLTAGQQLPNHGLGSIGGLSGEYTIWDEDLAVARAGEVPEFSVISVDDIDERSEMDATFIFATRVEEWTGVELSESLDLEGPGDLLADLLPTNGVDGAMPFRIQDDQRSGHVDEMVVPAGATIWIPAES